MKGALLSIVLLFAFSALKGQKVLLEKDPAIDTTKEKYGPNRKHFFHGYFGGGPILGPKNNGARLKALGNYNLVLGACYKLRINNFFAIGADANITNMVCNLRQENTKILPSTNLHKRERLNWMFINLSFFTRFNFNNRGNIIGNYIDLGARGSYCPSFVHYTMDKTADGRALRVRERGLNYYNPFAYSVFGRVGFNQFAISVSYRLSKLFKNQYNYPNIAPVSLTLEFSFY